MADTDFYYSITVEIIGSDKGAYLAVTPSPNLSISQGNATFGPTAPSLTMVTIYPQELQIEAPPGSMKAAVTIISSGSLITGMMAVSPAINVPVVVTAYGAGAKQIGQVILAPGVTRQPFSFEVDPQASISAANATGELKTLSKSR